MKNYQIVNDKIIIPISEITKVGQCVLISKQELESPTIDVIKYRKRKIAEEIGIKMLEDGLIDIKEKDTEFEKQMNFEIHIIKP